MYSHQRSNVTCMWKIVFVDCRPVGGQGGSIGTLTQLPRNARRDFFFSNTCQKMRGGKHVKVKKRWRQDILCFRADARKLILGSIGTPLDHLSVKGCGMGPWLVPPCFRENVVATCKIGSFLCSLDNLLQKNVIVFLFGNQI